MGCGTGYLTRIMARAVAPGGTVLGVDPSSEAIARARRLTRQANCTFSVGAAQAVREMYRVLRPGGSLLIAEFRPSSSRIGRNLTGPFISHAMRDNPLHLLGPMASEAGFEQVRSGDLHPWIYYVRATKPARPAVT